MPRKRSEIEEAGSCSPIVVAVAASDLDWLGAIGSVWTHNTRVLGIHENVQYWLTHEGEHDEQIRNRAVVTLSLWAADSMAQVATPSPSPTPAAQTPAAPPRPTPPTRDPNTPGYVTAKELPDGAVPPVDVDGNFIIGPTHNPAPEMTVQEDVPQGTISTSR